MDAMDSTTKDPESVPNGFLGVPREMLHPSHPLHPMSTGEEACPAFAWLDYVGLAAFTPHDGLKRGEVRSSERFLAQRWNWSKTTARRWLDRQQEAGRIEESDSGGPASTGVYKIVDYDRYFPADERTTPADHPEAMRDNGLRDAADHPDGPKKNKAVGGEQGRASSSSSLRSEEVVGTRPAGATGDSEQVGEEESAGRETAPTSSRRLAGDPPSGAGDGNDSGDPWTFLGRDSDGRPIYKGVNRRGPFVARRVGSRNYDFEDIARADLEPTDLDAALALLDQAAAADRSYPDGESASGSGSDGGRWGPRTVGTGPGGYPVEAGRSPYGPYVRVRIGDFPGADRWEEYRNGYLYADDADVEGVDLRAVDLDEALRLLKPVTKTRLPGVFGYDGAGAGVSTAKIKTIA